jgi:RimJ/RimL family protein N-acetyltransferase
MWLIDDPRLPEWAARRIPHVGEDGFGPCYALGIAKRGEIIATMVYHDFIPSYGNIQLSMAATSPAWARRTSIKELLRYPFNDLGVQRVTTMIAESNTRAIRLNEGLGFVREGLVRRGFGNDNAVILGLLREDAEKWIA